MLRMESNAAWDMESFWAGHSLENQPCSVWRKSEQGCDRKIRIIAELLQSLIEMDKGCNNNRKKNRVKYLGAKSVVKMGTGGALVPS